MRYTEATKPSSPTEVVLAHVGVKGMKWGVRKANPTGSEIRNARVNQDARERQFHRSVDRLNLAAAGGSTQAKKAAVKNFQATRKEFLTNEDRVTAARTTRGEALAHVFLLGPLALVTLPAMKARQVAVTRSVDRERASG